MAPKIPTIAHVSQLNALTRPHKLMLPQAIPSVVMRAAVRSQEPMNSRTSTSGPWMQRSAWPSADVLWSLQPTASPTRLNDVSLPCRARSKSARGHLQASPGFQEVRHRHVFPRHGLRQSPALYAMSNHSMSLSNTPRFLRLHTAWSSSARVQHPWKLISPKPTPSTSTLTLSKLTLSATPPLPFCLLC